MKLLKKFYSQFRDYFAFTQTEARGVLVLLVLMSLLLVSPLFYKHFLQKLYTAEKQTQDQALLDSLMHQLEQNYQIEEKNEPVKESKFTAKLYTFNPNTADENTFTDLGFRPWIAERIIKYREAGGRFVKKEDLLKIYGISDETYQKVYHYIDLPEIETVAAPANHFSKPVKEKAIEHEAKAVKFNINIADTTQLMRLPGIGRVFAARIVKYRDLLGGFVDTAQYAEVYGLSPEAIGRLQTQSVIPKTEVAKKINLNTADEKTLAAHPYISFKVAKAIITHRNNYGAFTKIEDLKEVYLVDEDLFAKIAHYIVI
jgi:competence protein ComEA